MKDRNFKEMIVRMKKGKNLPKKLLRKVNRDQIEEIETGMADTYHLYFRARMALEQARSKKERASLKKIMKNIKILMKKEAAAYRESLDVRKEIERL